MRCQLQLPWCFRNAQVLYFHFDCCCHLIKTILYLRFSNRCLGSASVICNDCSKAAVGSCIYSQSVISLAFGGGEGEIIESQMLVIKCAVKQWKQKNSARMLSTVERTKPNSKQRLLNTPVPVQLDAKALSNTMEMKDQLEIKHNKDDSDPLKCAHVMPLLSISHRVSSQES